MQSSRANEFNIFQQPGSRYYSVRLTVHGNRRRFSTGETSIKAARSKTIATMISGNQRIDFLPIIGLLGA